MKTAVITGANTGVGYETALGLAKRNFQVVMLCRSKERGEKAQKKIMEESGNENISLILADLASLESLKKAAEKIIEQYPVIDVLVNNAGIFALKKEYTKDGFEKMTGVNHIGHSQLLLPSLKKAKSARIVVVSSNMYKIVRFRLSDLHPDSRFLIAESYGRSKLVTLLFAMELSNRLSNTSITVNALHPGAVTTSIVMNLMIGFGKTVYKFLRLFFKTPEEGAQTSLYLATSEEVEGVSGKYYMDSKPALIKGLGKDKKLAQRVYEKTEEMIIQKGYNL